MNNFRIDGWQPRHWHDVVDYSKDLARCAADLTSAIDTEGDKLEPGEVRALAGRLDIIARRLRELSDDY